MSHWIPTEVRLPPDGDDVLLMQPCCGPGTDIFVGHYSTLHRCFFADGQVVENITHWQHLPTPPNL